MSRTAQHADGRRTPQGGRRVDALNGALVAHDHAAAEEAHAGHHVSGNLRHPSRAIAGQDPERDEQARAACDERDGAQTGGTLADLPFDADCDTTSEGSEQPPDKFKRHGMSNQGVLRRIV